MARLKATYKTYIRGHEFARDLYFYIPNTWEDIKDILSRKERKSRIISKAIITMDDDLLKLALIKYGTGKYFARWTLEQIDDYKRLKMSELSILDMPSFYLLGDLPREKFEYESLRTLQYMQDLLDELLVEGNEKAIWYMLALMRLRRIKKLHRSQINKLGDRLYKWRSIFGRTHQRAAALAYTYGSISFVQDLYKTTIFRPATDTTNPPTTYAIHFGWYQIAQQVAAANVWIDVDATLDAEFHDVAAHLIIEQQNDDQRIANANKIN